MCNGSTIREIFRIAHYQFTGDTPRQTNLECWEFLISYKLFQLPHDGMDRCSFSAARQAANKHGSEKKKNEYQPMSSQWAVFH